MLDFMSASFFQSPGGFAYFGLLSIFYGLYFGVLDRDFAELCTDTMATELGVGSASRRDLPSKPLAPNICVICNDPLMVIGQHGILKPKEKIVELDCKHSCHDFCIRGWSMIGKKDVCPYPLCREKVSLKNIFENPWQTQSVLWMHLLDLARYLIVWYPLMVVGLQYILSLFDKDFASL